MTSTAAKCSECKVRAGWVESQEAGHYACELVRCECGLHEFDAFDVWEAGHMVEVGWIWMSAYLLVDLEGCSAAKFPGVEDIRGGNGAKALQSFG